MYEKLYNKLKANTDLVTHEFYLNNKKINLIHNEVLCSSDFINHYILTKITNLSYSDDDIQSAMRFLGKSEEGKRY